MRLLAALSAMLLLGGCALGADQAATEGGSLPQELAAPADPLLPEEEPPADLPEETENGKKGKKGGKAEDPAEDETTSGGGNGGKKKGKGKKGGGTSGDVIPPPPPGGQGTTSTRLVQVDDAAGDSGHDTAYADTVRLTIVDNGNRAVVTVDFAGAIPNPLPAREVMGIGVDIFLGSSSESDYQLFADGADDGWYAYLHTPSGIEDFPGTFRLGGQRMVFEVPWSALGDPRSGRVSSFADWSRSGGVVLNPASEDHVPDSGTRTFSR